MDAGMEPVSKFVLKSSSLHPTHAFEHTLMVTTAGALRSLYHLHHHQRIAAHTYTSDPMFPSPLGITPFKLLLLISRY